MSDAGDQWATANQRDVVRAIEHVRHLLLRHASRGATPGDEATAPQPNEGTGPVPDDGFALATLEQRFGLSPFERLILVMCAGVEMDARFASVVASAHGDPTRTTPTFGLALAALPGAHWSAITPGAPLRAWRMVELLGGGVTTAGLRLDERILQFIAGANQLDERLHGIADPLPAAETGHATFDAIAGDLAAQLARDPAAHAVQIIGAEANTRRAIATSACALLGASALALRATDVPVAPAERFALARLAGREALLSQSVLIVDAVDADGDRLAAFIEACPTPVIVSVGEPVPAIAEKAVTVEVPAATYHERVAVWNDALGANAEALAGAVRGICDQFNLTPQAIREVAGRTRGSAHNGATQLDASSLWTACRLVARPRLDGLAQRIDALAGWDDLVLPEPQRRVLRDIAVHVRQRHRVHDEWGFADKSARGLGITALFAGASGTGKTMAAEVLARELRLDLYRIDLASVVSKYIGETEKNLKRLFDAAEGSGAILLFDEADALFGKRTETKDSHDRYANIEVSYLLQRMEAYRGLAVLTTNMKHALDPAFLRRIRFVVHFPFPAADQREAIWRGVFPTRTPTAALDYERLAQLSVAGGNIRNIALAAAFLAADRGEEVGMRHVADATRGEYAKLERVPSETEMRGWV